jgi:hypothetical protein
MDFARNEINEILSAERSLNAGEAALVISSEPERNGNGYDRPDFINVGTTMWLKFIPVK